MKKFIFKRETNIPDSRIEDTKELQKFIKEKMDINISLTDTFLLWDSISDSWCAGWLDINTHPDGDTREEFLLYEMIRRGYFI